jgi:hypothetical protein
MVISKYFDILDESKRHQDRSLYKDLLSILEEHHLQRAKKKEGNRSIF